jgi:hypothetical protein
VDGVAHGGALDLVGQAAGVDGGADRVVGFRAGLAGRPGVGEVEQMAKDLTGQQLAFQQALDEVLLDVRTMLVEKNRKYGNSALKPCRVFSKAGPVEQIKVRIDDKLSRLMSGQHDDTEDSEFDLLGYLVLLQIARHRAVALS